MFANTLGKCVVFNQGIFDATNRFNEFSTISLVTKNWADTPASSNYTIYIPGTPNNHFLCKDLKSSN